MNFKANDYVWITIGDKRLSGDIDFIYEENGARIASVFVPEYNDYFDVETKYLELIEPVIIKLDQFEQFISGTIDRDELLKDVIPEGNFIIEGKYKLTLETYEKSLKEALEYETSAEIIRSSAEAIIHEFEDYIEWPINKDEEDLLHTGRPTESRMAKWVIKWMSNLLWYDYDNDYIDEQAEDVVKDLKKYRKKDKVYPWTWSEEMAEEYLYDLKEDELSDIDEDTLNEIRETALDLADNDNYRMIEKVGYWTYGGSPIFPCDWGKSRDCFEKLMNAEEVEDEKKSYYANTLGYIYYYGRCNDDIPEYKKAYKYYSIGAAGGVYESIYKLSDMFKYGYGVHKNMHIAETLIAMILEDNLKHMEKGHYDCQFADIARRMAILSREDDDDYFEEEHRYLLLADCAIRKRLPYHHYGDTSVFVSIQRSLERLRREGNREDDKIMYLTMPYPFTYAVSRGPCKFTITPVKDDEDCYTITAERLETAAIKGKYFFTCIPPYDYCTISDKVTLTALEVRNLWTLEDKNTFIADEITLEGDDLIFRKYDEIVAKFQYEDFTLEREEKPVTQTYHFASVKFNLEAKPYDYLYEDMEINPGDKVIVKGKKNETTVTVEEVFNVEITDEPVDLSTYSKIIRKV